MTKLVKVEVLPPARIGLGELLTGWLSTKKEATVRTYKADLDDFALWYGAKTCDEALFRLFSMASPEANAVVLAYRSNMLERKAWSTIAKRKAGEPPDLDGLAPATVNRRLSAIRSLSKLARITGKFQGEILIKGVPAQTYRNTRGIGAKAYQAIIKSIENEVAETEHIPENGPGWARYPTAIRDLAIYRLLHDAGLRRVEVIRLRLMDVDVAHKTVILRPKGPKGVTKTWPLARAPWRTLRGWMDLWEHGKGTGPVFHGVAHPSRPLALSMINYIVSSRGDKVGVAVRPHDLRHTAITSALDRTNGNVRLVAQFSRHANVKTVMIYDDARNTETRKLQELIED